MATLQNIRNRAGLLVAIIIGLALLAFVLGDLFNSGRSLFSNSQYEIAKVADKSIPYSDYQKRVEDLVEVYKTQGRTNLDESFMDNIQEETWNSMIQELVMKDEYNKLGLAVTGDELMDMIQGDNPHPIIRNFFTDPKTGILNRSALYRFLQSVVQDEESDQRTFWLYTENVIYKQRKIEKYDNLIKQGLFVTSLQAKKRSLESNKIYDFDFIVQRFNSIPDSAITATESDIREYYKTHKTQFEQEESRDLKYVYFEVVPSEEDHNAAEKWINEIKPEFEETKETKQFVNLQSDTPYDNRNYKNGELPKIINDVMFNAEIGDVYGPYFENEAFKLAKLAEINYLPDSVKARHILLQVTQENVNQMRQLADSLKMLVENGADFAELARTNSTDGSARDGGDLGWFHEGDMIKPFSDSCFYGNVGDIKMVFSQFGIHIIEILAQSRDIKKVQVGILERKVIPSEETEQHYYSLASEFGGLNNTYDKFNKAIEKQKLIPRYAKDLKPLDKTIPGLESPRDLIKWAYNADEFEVSDVKKFGNKYVVATVENVKEAGIADIEDVRPEIEVEVRKEKKANIISDKIKSKMSSSETLEKLALELNTKVNTATSVRYSTPSIPEGGIEPKVIAAAFSLEEEKLSDPITGNNGVYVISVTSVSEPDNLDSDSQLERQKRIISGTYSATAGYSAFEAIKKVVGVVDNRVNFY